MATTVAPERKFTGMMSELNETGDTKTVWDKDNEEEVEEARAQFDRLTKKGFKAFKVDKRGDQGEQMKRFDPNAEKIIFVPQYQGG